MAAALSILLLISLVSYFAIVRPIMVESQKLEKELIRKRLEEQQRCQEMRELVMLERGLRLKCVII